MNKTTYYEKHKDRIKQYAKAYYVENKSKMQEYQKKYQTEYRKKEGFKEWKKDYMKNYLPGYNKKNPPDPVKQKERMKKYFEKNRERLNEYWRNYRKTDRGKEVMRINNWKQIGVKDTDFRLLYESYKKETHCWICGCEYTRPRQKHLDHDHETGEVRYICCMKCNIQVLGQKQNKS